MGTSDDELEIDPADQATVEEVLLVEALMGWDGDRCACDCGCERFRDGADARCRPCRQGSHADTPG